MPPSLRVKGSLAIFFLQTLDQVFGAAQHAGRGAADLDMGTRSDRLQLELRIEGGDFENTDIGHAEHVGDRLDRRPRHQPSCS